jgi:hypothetical protein
MVTARRRVVSTRVASIVLVLWLVIGLAAAVQRDYIASDRTANCSTLSTTLVTIVAGPLNYVGLNPKVRCEVPQPSR